MAWESDVARSSASEARGHEREPEQHRVPAADAHADEAGGQRADDPTDGPGDEAHGRFLRPHGEAFGAVQGEPRGEALKGELQQERRDEDLAHAGDHAARGGPGRIDERSERGFSGRRLRPGRLAKRERECPGDGEHGARGHQKGRLHAEHAPQHEEDDRPDAHLKRDGPGAERAIARRQEVGDEGLKGRSLKVDPAVQQDHRGHDAGDAEACRPREEGHAGSGQHEAGDDER